ncbi:MAG: tRNA uridine-5-carboxymethylaminomethyl(34) synthesis enzyme MnmG [Planctomycetes bacterium]|nr:tRNA uridine-5-carboxymethylaminomethyl(34) synthesis enzyme MnmG [Planctomycetota bacterium]
MQYDVIVVGAGHAGCEAALATARMGCKTLVLTMSRDTIAQMSCNPAIGGLAKGQLVREIDALGGQMGRAIDATGIQFRMLNTSRGPAVQSPRAQADRKAYHQYMKQTLESQSNITIMEAMAEEILTEANKVIGVTAKPKNQSNPLNLFTKAVILTTGTFMKGVIHIGDKISTGGRIDEPSAEHISDSLRRLGLELGRLKTGTPPRLHKNSLDYAELKIQPGDDIPKPFSFSTERITQEQVPCYITYTNAETHQIIKTNLHRAPLYTGQIKAVGPAYCPSIETKIERFADKDRHQLFLEPEGRDVPEIYCNGISTSLPADVQEEMVHSISGLTKARFIRYGYAIEYDFILPHQIKPTLGCRRAENLFLAGQINGTSGYEEAAAQGIMAGINAALKLQGKEAFILRRDEAYIGVLIDDLVTLGPTEPYRMFTSRAEYRLLLRSDNADRRLMPYGAKFGLITPEQKQKLDRKEELIQQVKTLLSKRIKQINPDNPLNQFTGKSLAQILKTQDAQLSKLIKLSPELSKLNLTAEVIEQVEIEVKYEGYIKRQVEQIARAGKMEDYRLSDGIDYTKIKHLSNEAKGKLNKFRPISLGQAGRIAGVTPADISVLMVYLKSPSTKSCH